MAVMNDGAHANLDINGEARASGRWPYDGLWQSQNSDDPSSMINPPFLMSFISAYLLRPVHRGQAVLRTMVLFLQQRYISFDSVCAASLFMVRAYAIIISTATPVRS